MQIHYSPETETTVLGLLTKHSGRIYRFLAERSGAKVLQATTLDDLFQETVVSATRSAHTFTFVNDDQFIGWIKTIARRAIARSIVIKGKPLVRLRNHGSSGPGVGESGLTPTGRTPSSLVSSVEQRNRLKDALDRLPEDYRKILTIYKLEERPLDEVAREMKRSKGATCQLLARATTKLREVLGS